MPRSDVPVGDEDETTSFPRPRPEPGGGYIPPSVGSPQPAGERSRPRRRAPRGANRGSWVATVLLVALAAGVVWLVFALGSGGLRLGTGPSDAALPSRARVVAVATVEVFTALGLRKGEILTDVTDVVRSRKWPTAARASEAGSITLTRRIRSQASSHAASSPYS